MLDHRIFKKNIDSILFLVLMLPLSIMLFAKCRYGFAIRDEAFYLTIPYRLVQGDVLLLNEWHPSQLVAWVLQVPVKWYLLLFGNTDGILLAFRYLYVAVHICGSTALYVMLRKVSGIGAVLSAVFYCLYVPFGISALSYNTLGIEFLTISAVILACSSPRLWSTVLSGFLFALAVLCCPYLAVIYVVYGAAVLLLRLTRRSCDDLPFLRTDRFLRFSIGVFAAAIAFLSSVLPYVPFSKWSRIIEEVLSDPEHQRSFREGILTYFQIVFTRKAVLFPIAATILGCLLKKERARTVCSTIVLLATAYSVLRSASFINNLMFPLALAGLYFYLVYRNTAVKGLFFGVWIPGMLYTLCIHLASNQDFAAISSAAAVPLVASVVIIVVSLKPILCGNEKQVFKIGLILSALLLFTLQGYFQTHLRWTFLFRENSLAEQTVEITEGPYSGLLVTPEKKAQYMADLDAASHLKPDGTVLFFGNTTYYYLFGSWENGGYSAWLFAPNRNTLERLELYYRVNPDKLPDQVFIDAAYSDYTSTLPGNSMYTLSCVTERGDRIFSRVS